MSTILECEIADILEGVESPPTPDWPVCIYRVPQSPRKLNDAAYTPEVISIGPLHHGKGDLHKMEMHKVQFVSYFLKRSRLSLGQLVIFLKERETSIRSCYAAGPLEPDSDKFLKIILVDAIFIIEYFYMSFYESLPEGYIQRVPLPQLSAIELDLILLENQLPFPLLEELYELAFPHDSTNERPSFLALALDFFYRFDQQEKLITMPHNIMPHNIKHFTDLIRFFYVPLDSIMTDMRRNNDRTRPAEGRHSFLRQWFKDLEEISETDKMPSATELDKAGVALKMTRSKNLFDINYKEGVLEIPCLIFDDATEIILRNMMALEQCHYRGTEWIISEYVMLLNDLINTYKDADLLVKKGIINNILTSNEAVAEHFNKLSKYNFRSNSYYATVRKDLIRHYNVPWHNWKATFKHDYLRTPWSTASTIAAVILLFLTFIQTICSILSVPNL